MRHTISKHYDKLSPEERQSLESRESVNSSEVQELDNCKRGVVQRSITKYTMKDRDCVLSRRNPMTKRHDRHLGLWIVKDLKPLSDCDSAALNMFAKSLNGHYNLPSKETLKTNIIIPMYEENKQAIKELLALATDVALTCDN